MAILYRAPVTKLVLAVCGLATLTYLADSVDDAGGRITPITTASWKAVVSQRQLWRLFVSPLVCDSLMDCIMLCALLYRTAIIERLMGSSKHALLCILAYGVAIGIRALALFVLRLPAVAAGPFELAFALLMYYWLAVPPRVPQWISIGRVSVSDKVVNYALAAHIMASYGLLSITQCAAGALLGLLHYSNVAGLGRLACPAFIRAAGARYVCPWWEGESPAVRAAREQQRREAAEAAEEQAVLRQAAAIEQLHQLQARMGAGGMNNRRGRSPGTPAVPDFGPTATTMPSAALAEPALSAAVERIAALGFPRDRATRALQDAFGDETAAINRLLDGN